MNYVVTERVEVDHYYLLTEKEVADKLGEDWREKYEDWQEAAKKLVEDKNSWSAYATYEDWDNAKYALEEEA